MGFVPGQPHNPGDDPTGNRAYPSSRMWRFVPFAPRAREVIIESPLTVADAREALARAMFERRPFPGAGGSGHLDGTIPGRDVHVTGSILFLGGQVGYGGGFVFHLDGEIVRRGSGSALVATLNSDLRWIWASFWGIVLLLAVALGIAGLLVVLLLVAILVLVRSPAQIDASTFLAAVDEVMTDPRAVGQAGR